MVEADLTRSLAEHPFLSDLTSAQVGFLAGCTKNQRYSAGELLFQEDAAASSLFLLRSGKVALQAQLTGRGAVQVETLTSGDVLGWSVLFPPYRWHVDGRAVEPTLAFVVDGECLRGKIESDVVFGYALIEGLLIPAFANPALLERHDAAVLDALPGRLALTTDAYVVKPLFFPGGDIGRLAVCGTINDLAMAGAEPRYVTLSLIIEEGLPLSELRRVVESAALAAREAGVAIVAGDTKVVDRGHCDRLYLSTAGVGVVSPGVDVRPARIQPGDALLVSGDLGRHGIAVLSVREGIAFETTLESDCAPLHRMVRHLIEQGIDVHCLRDLTRGGLASALNELALDTASSIDVSEAAVPVSEPVQAACELLGLDPLYVANEGRFVAVVAEQDAERALAAAADLLNGTHSATQPLHAAARREALAGRDAPPPRARRHARCSLLDRAHVPAQRSRPATPPANAGIDVHGAVAARPAAGWALSRR